MYITAVDEHEGLVVWYPSNPTPAEWETHLKDVQSVIGWSKRLGKRPAILLLANEFARPDAKGRMRISELTGHPDYDPHIAFISSNAMLRGLLTVFSWMHQKPRYDMNYLADEAAGVAWLEQRRGERLPRLDALLTDVHARALLASSRSSAAR